MTSLNRIITIIRGAKEEIYTFWVTLGVYFLASFSPNNKILVLFFFFYFFLLYLLNKDLKKSLLFTYLATWPLRVGKTYEIELVSAWQLGLPWRPYGIANFIVISIKEVFIFLMLAFLIKDHLFYRKKVFKFDTFATILALYFLSLVIASLFGSIRPEISLIYSFFSIEPLILYFYLRNYLKSKKRLIFNSLAILSSLVVIEGVLATLQFIKQNTIGLSIEISHEFLPLSMGVDEDIFTFRPLTTFYHANEFAQFLLPIIFILFPFIFSKFRKSGNKIYAFSFIIGFWSLLLSLSRSAWLSFFICILAFLFIVEKKWKIKLRLQEQVKRLLFASQLILLPIMLFFIVPRLVNTFYSLEIYGGAYTRLELIKKSLETITQFPIFGVGLGMDVFYTYQNTLRSSDPSVLLTFPEAVHNGYLHLLSQTGIISSLFFYGCCLIFIRKIFINLVNAKTVRYRIFLLSTGLGLLALFFNNFFQPGHPDLQVIIFASMMYAQNVRV